MENKKKEPNETPAGTRPGSNHYHTPAKPPSLALQQALSNLSLIILITVVKNYVNIFYNDKQFTHTLIKGTLKSAMELCKADYMMRTHKSYIVNLNFGVEFYSVFDSYEMLMTNKETVIIGEFSKPEFHERRKAFPNIQRRRRS